MILRASSTLVACVTVAGLLGIPSANATKPLRDSGDAPWSAERHPPPRPADWQSAPDYVPRRVAGQNATQCNVQRLDEWLRIRCPSLKTSAITQIGGLTSGVSSWIAPAGDDRMPGEGQLYLPARQGDRRVFLFWTLGPGYDGPLTVVPSVVVQQYWLEAEDAPVVIISDALHEPVSTKSNPQKREPQ